MKDIVYKWRKELMMKKDEIKSYKNKMGKLKINLIMKEISLSWKKIDFKLRKNIKLRYKV
jgi:hypothetical protein